MLRMKTPKFRVIKPRLLAVITGICALCNINTEASDWIGGSGSWNDAANWSAGVPSNSGGQPVGNVSNGGTAIVSNAAPTIDEAWTGNNGVAGNIIVTNGDPLELTTDLKYLFIKGQLTSTDNRHKRLFEKYSNRPKP